jgi:hypothetical protein
MRKFLITAALAVLCALPLSLRAEQFNSVNNGKWDEGTVNLYLNSAGQAQAVSQTNPLPVGSTTLASATFTRPATAPTYASGQLVANSATAGSVVPMQFTVARANDGTGMVRRCTLLKSSTGLTGASFRIHLYRASPTPSNGDTGVWLTNNAANYLGSCDVTMDKAFTDGAVGTGTPSVGSEINFKAATGTQLIYGLLEARGAYVGVSAETITPILEVVQN